MPPMTGLRGARLRRPWLRSLTDLAVLAAVVLLFTYLHDLAGTDIAQATANARALQAIERALGIDVELPVNRWLAGSPPLIWVAVWYYRLYYLPLGAVLLWLLLRRPALYRQVLGVLLVMASVALVLFWLLPMSPPRFALPGIVDVVADHDVIAGAASRDLGSGKNHFSAFPSMHVGWALLCAYAAWRALRQRYPRGSLSVWLFPLLMIGVVIATGNHYVLDVAGSLALLGLSVSVAALWRRLFDSRPAGQAR